MNKGWRGLFLGTGIFLTVICMLAVVYIIFITRTGETALLDAGMVAKSMATAVVMIVAALI